MQNHKIFLFAYLIFSFSCDSPTFLEAPIGDQSGDVIMFDNFDRIILMKNPLLITKTRIEKDSLIINVEYSGGCRDHKFKLFIGKWILKSNPPQAELFLAHNSDGDLCEAYIKRELRFTLSPLKNWFNSKMNLSGQLLLRIYEPNKNEPFEPLINYYL